MQEEVARPAKASSAGCCGLHRLDMNLCCCRLFDLWWFMEWPQWKHERMSACTVPINSNPTCFEILSAKWICERFTGLLLSFFSFSFPRLDQPTIRDLGIMHNEVSSNHCWFGRLRVSGWGDGIGAGAIRKRNFPKSFPFAPGFLMESSFLILGQH